MIPSSIDINKYLLLGGSFVDRFHVNDVEVEQTIKVLNRKLINIKEHIDQQTKRLYDIELNVIQFSTHESMTKSVFNTKHVIKLWEKKQCIIESAIDEVKGIIPKIQSLSSDIASTNDLVKKMLKKIEIREETIQQKDEAICIFTSSDTRDILEALFWWRRRYDYNATVAPMLKEVRYKNCAIYMVVQRHDWLSTSDLCTKLALQMNIDWNLVNPYCHSTIPDGIVLYDRAKDKLPRYSYSKSALRKCNPLKRSHINNLN